MKIKKWGFEVNEKDCLVMGGCDSLKLAGEFGTPLHVIDKNRLLSAYDKFVSAFNNQPLDVETFYSYKTNCLPGILQILHKEGAGAEVISHYELWLAIKLGVEPEKIVFNGPNKSPDSLRLAVQHDIKLVNIDSMNEILMIEKIASELGKRASVGVRVKPPVGWKAQFGFDIESGEAFQAYETLKRSEYFDVKAMHVHIGTGIKNPGTYVKAVEQMLYFAKLLKEKLNIEIKYLDIGGGFGVSTVKNFSRIGGKLYSYFNNVPKIFLERGISSIENFSREITGSVLRSCRKFNLSEPVLIVEPGRFITSSAQVLLLTIGVLKKAGGNRNVAITDGSKVTMAYPVSFEYHEAFIANRMSRKRDRKYRITGNLCTPADVLFRNKKLPEVKEGDILAVMDTGAYFISFSNNFAFPRPPAVLVSEGKSTLIRSRESFEHLIALDNLSGGKR